MAEPDNDRIYIDDVTGGRIASPDVATNGGSTTLRGAAAKAWIDSHPDIEAKEVAKSENKARKAPATK